MLTAYKGTTKLNEEEFRAHIANLLRLENVGVLFGAGASVSAGGKVMNQIWKDFEKDYPESRTWLEEENYFSTDNLVDGKVQICPDIEKTIDDLSISIHELTRIEDDKANFAKKAKSDLLRAIVDAVMLKKEFWTQPHSLVSDSELSSHRDVLQKIISTRQPGQSAPWFFTTNYDLAIEWAAESIETSVINGFLGIHNRQFSPHSFDLGLHNTQARGEASFGTYNIYLVKLHGSLSWKNNQDWFYETQGVESIRIIEDFIKNGRKELELLVYPSAAKYSQTYGFLFGELFRRFGDFMSRPQTVLFIVGFGFNDVHINRYLKSALLNPTLQLVIYFPNFHVDKNDNFHGTNDGLDDILKLKSPRITIVGGGSEAKFDAFASHLPDPSIFDENFQNLKERIKKPIESPPKDDQENQGDQTDQENQGDQTDQENQGDQTDQENQDDQGGQTDQENQDDQGGQTDQENQDDQGGQTDQENDDIPF